MNVYDRKGVKISKQDMKPDIVTKWKRGVTRLLKTRMVPSAYAAMLNFCAVLKQRLLPQKRLPHTTRVFRTGFTLIETLVAIIVLVAAIVGPLTLTARSLFSAFVARDQLTASFLAQDAMEFIRYRRDTNILNDDPIFQGLDACLGGNGCKVETLPGNVSACSSTPCEPLRYDAATGEYSYDNNDSATTFSRRILITSITGTNEYNVEVKVEWQTRTLNREFTVEEVMYKWVDF